MLAAASGGLGGAYDIVFLVSGVVALVGAFGAIAAGIFRTAALRATVQDQSASIAALKERLTLAEQAEGECRAREKATLERLGQLEGAYRVLQEQVTGAAAVAQLADLVRSQHEIVVAELKRLERKVDSHHAAA